MTVRGARCVLFAPECLRVRGRQGRMVRVRFASARMTLEAKPCLPLQVPPKTRKVRGSAISDQATRSGPSTRLFSIYAVC